MFKSVLEIIKATLIKNDKRTGAYDFAPQTEDLFPLLGLVTYKK